MVVDDHTEEDLYEGPAERISYNSRRSGEGAVTRTSPTDLSTAALLVVPVVEIIDTVNPIMTT